MLLFGSIHRLYRSDSYKVAFYFALIMGGRADFHCGWPVSDGLVWGDDRVSAPHFFFTHAK